MRPVKLTPQQRRELLAEAQCSVNTLRRWISKETMKPTVKARLDAAAKVVMSKTRKSSQRGTNARSR